MKDCFDDPFSLESTMYRFVRSINAAFVKNNIDYNEIHDDLIDEILDGFTDYLQQNKIVGTSETHPVFYATRSVLKKSFRKYKTGMGRKANMTNGGNEDMY